MTPPTMRLPLEETGFRDLVRRAVESGGRDEDQFFEMVREFAFAVVVRRLGAEAADQISSLVAEEAWEKRETIACWPGSLHLYLRTLVKWRTKDYLRGQPKAVPLLDDCPTEALGNGGPGQDLEHHELLIGLENLAAEMRPVERAVFDYLIHFGYPPPAIWWIAKELKLTPEQVKYARIKIRDKVQPYLTRSHGR